MSFKGRTPEELIIISLAAICLSGQIPYGIYRLSMGDWLIGGIDFFGAALCLTVIYQVIMHHRVWPFGALMSVAAISGVLLIVHNGESADAQFMYPVVMMSYFLLKPLRALLLTVIAVIGLGVILYQTLDLFVLSKLLISIMACSVFAFVFSSMRNRQSEHLVLLSTRDPLTGVLNRRSLDERLEQFVLQTKRQALEATLIILDLDSFKQTNDKYGHAYGDRALSRVASKIAQRIRATDQLFRYVGDEFVLFVTDVSLAQSLSLVEDLRDRVEATEAMEGTNLSISLGVSSYKEGQTGADWLRSADVGLLKAKQAGRNQVITDSVVATKSPSPIVVLNALELFLPATTYRDLVHAPDAVFTNSNNPSWVHRRARTCKKD